MKPGTVIVEQYFDVSPPEIWAALTENRLMKKWYFDIDNFQAIPGFSFTFSGGTDKKTYLHLCRVKEVIPGKKLSYTWKYDGFPGKSLVQFEIIPHDEQTMVRLTHSGLDTFPANEPDFAQKNFEEGWNQIIRSGLKEFVEKKLPGHVL